MIRIAAAGDIHAGADVADALTHAFSHVGDDADVLLLAGDLTRIGDPDEARVLADALAGVEVPVVAVLGNHDHHSDRPDEVREVLGRARITVLEGGATTVAIHGTSIGIAGVKGFGGGFEGASAPEFGEPETKAFIRHTKERSEALERSLATLQASVKIALLHYSPIRATLEGEPPEIYSWLGSFLLAEACDRGGAHLVVHGHAHAGRERGRTPAGVPVRNVALPVIGRPYAVYTLEESVEAPHLPSRFDLRDAAEARAHA